MMLAVLVHQSHICASFEHKADFDMAGRSHHEALYYLSGHAEDPSLDKRRDKLT